MTGTKSSFVDKVLGRIDRMHTEGLQTVVQRLAREKNFLETLFNVIEDGILVTDMTGKILYFNQSVTQLLGLPASAEGQRVTRFLPGLDWPKLASLNRDASARIVRHELEVNYPQPRFLRLFAAPLENSNAGNGGLALILHDATEARKKTFEAIESERVQALTLLAASVAHEIGNPLNALNIHLQLMERELKKLKQTVTAKEGLAKPLRSALRARASQHTSEIIEITDKLDHFQAVAKGEIDRLDYIITQFLQAIRPSQPRIEMASLNAIVSGALDLLKPELENRGLVVKEKMSRQMPLAPLDPAQIKQVLVNLIKNAMQAMTKGGVLTAQTGETPDDVWFSIEDTGGGIPQETMNRIFEPFYTTKAKGSGLGLMIVQRIVREHGGRIELDSRAGQGATFRIRFPLHEPHPRLLEARTHD